MQVSNYLRYVCQGYFLIGENKIFMQKSDFLIISNAPRVWAKIKDRFFSLINCKFGPKDFLIMLIMQDE